MKYLISTLLVAFLLVSCSQEQEGNVIPEDIAAKKALLKTKRAEAKALASFIDSLDQAIFQQDPSSRQEEKALVKTAPLERKDFYHYVEVQGTVTADDYVDVSAEVPGRILSLNVKEGQAVRKGQLIATIDPEATKKQIAELETGIELAQTVYERQKRLWDQQIGSEIQFLQAKNNVDRLNKNLELLNLQLKKTNVYAPVSGEVQRVVLQSGELASPGMPIIMMINMSNLKVVVDLPEKYLTSVKKGERIEVHFPALDKDLTLPVNLIGNVINSGNRTLPIELALNGGNATMMKPNLLALAKINDLTVDKAITVPIELVQQEIGGKDYILIAENNKAKKVYVKTGESYDGNILIKEGLEGNEIIIVEGARGLLNGAAIEAI
ncbi:MAG: efflux RND transporter periplasmic adaptor subunit [Saprospiraceae bacterium]|nr:efflux RND transporter periplasmic adaptor subunit [Saprospiraceae bacterium]MCB9324522.1 efflux RND transporter periplasmic adaptor subunit [Lewinellaceae bacterium]